MRSPTMEWEPHGRIVGCSDKWLRQLAKNGVIGKFTVSKRQVSRTCLNPTLRKVEIGQCSEFRGSYERRNNCLCSNLIGQEEQLFRQEW